MLMTQQIVNIQLEMAEMRRQQATIGAIQRQPTNLSMQRVAGGGGAVRFGNPVNFADSYCVNMIRFNTTPPAKDDASKTREIRKFSVDTLGRS